MAKKPSTRAAQSAARCIARADAPTAAKLSHIHPDLRSEFARILLLGHALDVVADQAELDDVLAADIAVALHELATSAKAKGVLPGAGA